MTDLYDAILLGGLIVSAALLWGSAIESEQSRREPARAWKRERKHVRKSRVTFVWPRINP